MRSGASMATIPTSNRSRSTSPGAAIILFAIVVAVCTLLFSSSTSGVERTTIGRGEHGALFVGTEKGLSGANNEGRGEGDDDLSMVATADANNHDATIRFTRMVGGHHHHRDDQKVVGVVGRRTEQQQQARTVNMPTPLTSAAAESTNIAPAPLNLTTHPAAIAIVTGGPHNKPLDPSAVNGLGLVYTSVVTVAAARPPWSEESAADAKPDSNGSNNDNMLFTAIGGQTTNEDAESRRHSPHYYGQHPPLPLPRKIRERSVSYQDPLRHLVAAVITDGKFVERIDNLLGIRRQRIEGGWGTAQSKKTKKKHDDAKDADEGEKTKEIGNSAGTTDQTANVKSEEKDKEEGWLGGAFHTFLMFDYDQPLSRAVKRTHYGDVSIQEGDGGVGGGGEEEGKSEKTPPSAGQGTVGEFSSALLAAPHTVEFVTIPADKAALYRKAPNAAWKPWSTILFLAKQRTRRYLLAKEAAMRREGGSSGEGGGGEEGDQLAAAAPLWYGIIDDDAFTFKYNLAYALEPWTVQLMAQHRLETEERRERGENDGNPPSLPSGSSSSSPPLYIYGGHRITYCPTCNPKKRFPFVFGGNGIFLSRDAVVALAQPSVVEECRDLFSAIAGDEQLGGCIARSRTIQALHEANMKLKVANTPLSPITAAQLPPPSPSSSQHDPHSHSSLPLRTHYGFAPVDLFKGAVYDRPFYTLGWYYMMQRGGGGGGGGNSDEQQQQRLLTTPQHQGGGASLVSSEPNALPPFPISFHHVKDSAEVDLLRRAEGSWRAIVETVNSIMLNMNVTNIRRRQLTPLVPWAYVAGVLLADEAVVAAVLREWVVGPLVVVVGKTLMGVPTNSDDKTETWAQEQEQTIAMVMAKLVAVYRVHHAQGSRSSSDGTNDYPALLRPYRSNHSIVFPFYYDAKLIERRLWDEEQQRKQQGKKRRR